MAPGDGGPAVAPMVSTAGRAGILARPASRCGYAEAMNTDSGRTEAAATTVPGKPTLDGIEDKWVQRWAKERVVQV
jgi:hypothetical protein